MSAEPQLSIHPKAPNSLFEKIYRSIVFGSKDYGAKQTDAFLYGITVGWDDDEEDTWQEFKKQFGWTDEDIAAIKELQLKFI